LSQAAALVAEHYGDATAVRTELGDALTSCDRAARVFGWRAQFGWVSSQAICRLLVMRGFAF
jgi:hypothetical protein